ncbi:MAG: bifunctional folylpolyglutamate synthase/dihydrofolate synthase [Thermoplasmata archaeon]|nr:bifunctional folylpolyglutamate synthase/dihydrofolate synthase [Thermoplasmata archaeon]
MAHGPSGTTDAYRAALERLYHRRRFGLRPGLEVIRALLAELGEPQRKWKAIHVTGSKGKGSVAAMAASILSVSAGPTGLYTSPHLQSYRERIQVDGTPIDVPTLLQGLERVESAAERVRLGYPELHEPTFFEVTTAVAFDHFARAGVAAAVVEVGIGGRWDATNVLEAPVGVVSSIELEHTDILGPTLTHIAHEKAGIFHPGMRGVLGEQKPGPAEAVAREASALGVPIWRLGREIMVSERELGPRSQTFNVRTPRGERTGVRIPLYGPVQASNAALAIAAAELFLEALGKRIPDAELRRALRGVRWRGRLEALPGRPRLFADVAHTPESVRAVCTALGELLPMMDPTENALLFGCVRGKAAGAMLETLREVASTLILVPVRSERSEDPKALLHEARGRFSRTVLAPTFSEGLRLLRASVAPQGLGLVVGSDYLVGELLNEVEGADPNEPDLSDPLLAPPGVGNPPERPA